MNRYFYVPVTSNLVMHDGTSLANHLKMIDLELYNRGTVDDCSSINGNGYAIQTGVMYRERLLPERVVVVSGGANYFYELVSEEVVSVESIDMLLPYEVTGLDVLDVFYSNPEYKHEVWNFFDSYKKINCTDTQKDEDIKQKKIGQRLVQIFRRKSNK